MIEGSICLVQHNQNLDLSGSTKEDSLFLENLPESMKEASSMVK